MCVEGVNTGVGGSANTRTEHVEQLQASLVSMMHCGVLYPLKGSNDDSRIDSPDHTDDLIAKLQDVLPSEDSISVNCMPEAWVRSAILIRINSLIQGASSVRPVIVERLVELLKSHLIPRIPVQGSISASGDLSPLSYIAGAIQGKPHISVMFGANRQISSANRACAEAGLKPIALAAKEGVSLMNGTAFSSGVGALVMHDVFGLCALSQVLTAMSVEALRGSSVSFDPFFASLCPHPGQVSSESK